MKNNICPNCGGAITSEKCQYCGTLFFDFACLDLEKPFYIKIKHQNQIKRCKVKLTSFITKLNSNDDVCYCDNTPYYIYRNTEETIAMEFQVVPDGKLLGVIVDTDQVPDTVREWPTL